MLSLHCVSICSLARIRLVSYFVYTRWLTGLYPSSGKCAVYHQLNGFNLEQVCFAYNMTCSSKKVSCPFTMVQVGFLAQKRLARGTRLNLPECVALIATQVSFRSCRIAPRRCSSLKGLHHSSVDLIPHACFTYARGYATCGPSNGHR